MKTRTVRRQTRSARTSAATALPTSLRAVVRVAANDNPRDAFGDYALDAVSRWGALFNGPFQRPARTGVNRAYAHAVARSAAARGSLMPRDAAAASIAFAALSAELSRWCELAAMGAFDAHTIGPIVLAACDAAAICQDAAEDLRARGSMPAVAIVRATGRR